MIPPLITVALVYKSITPVHYVAIVKVMPRNVSMPLSQHRCCTVVASVSIRAIQSMKPKPLSVAIRNVMLRQRPPMPRKPTKVATIVRTCTVRANVDDPTGKNIERRVCTHGYRHCADRCCPRAKTIRTRCGISVCWLERVTYHRVGALYGSYSGAPKVQNNL